MQCLVKTHFIPNLHKTIHTLGFYLMTFQRILGPNEDI